MSLKLRILIPVALLVLFAYFSAYFVGKNRADYWIEVHEIASLDNHSQIVSELWDAMDGCSETALPDFKSMTEDSFAFTALSVQIKCKDNGHVATSTPFPEFVEPLSEDPEDYYERATDVNGEEWLVFKRESATAELILAMIYIEPRSISDFMWTPEFFILLGIILLAAIALYIFFAALLSPIRTLRKTAQGSDLDLQTLRTPSELTSLKNLLLTFKNDQATAEKLKSNQLDKERYFTANAAHELLTPLSAIKTEVQLQQRLVDDDEMKSWLGDLLTRVNRATHTVDQLMTLARLDPDGSPGETSPVDIAMLLSEISDHYKDRLDTKFVTVTHLYSNNNTVLAYPALVETLIRNLISNASKYTSPEGDIIIRTQAEGDHLKVSISNSCERLPEYLVDQMFERFVRGPHEVETGSGLGLAIAKRIAEIHGTKLNPTISSEKTRLTFEFILPLATPV